MRRVQIEGFMLHRRKLLFVTTWIDLLHVKDYGVLLSFRTKLLHRKVDVLHVVWGYNTVDHAMYQSSVIEL
jgi:hypothetical protein